MCRAPLAGRPDRRTCSAKCRAVLSRQAREQAQAVRDRELRRLLAAARANLDAADRLLSEPGP